MKNTVLNKILATHRVAMKVYVNVNGSLVPLEGVRIETMRDPEGNNDIVVLDLEEK